jgi:protein TonB
MPKPDFDSSVDSQGVDIGMGDINVNLNMQGSGGFSSDGEYLPIVKVAPVYPRRAQTRGIEGYVLLEFIVTKTGAVRNPVVIESQPSGIFDRSATSAALKFKYKPKVVNGEPVDVAGVRNLIRFELHDD